MKDWTGGYHSLFVCNGASNHTTEEREIDDYYATEPKALELLLNEESFNHKVWECACGQGHLSNLLLNKGFDVKNSDIKNRGVRKVLKLLTFWHINLMDAETIGI